MLPYSREEKQDQFEATPERNRSELTLTLECPTRCSKILSPDDPFVISKMSGFCNHLNGLSI